MKRDLAPDAATPVLAAALRRGRRASPRPAGGIAAKNPSDNYVAEGRVTRRFRLKKRKKVGARPGNLNSVRFPLDTPEDVALYRRIAAVTKSAKFIIRAINRDLRERRKETNRT